ncbi:MAG: helicase [Nitrospinales bacterium]
MSKLNNFKIKIETGSQGMDSPVKFNVNGFSIAFENGQGSVGPGGTFEASYEINSFPHSLTLVGPEKGVWGIKKIAVEYQCEDLEPYSALFGEVTLDEKTEVNIWKEPPLPSFDV